MVLRTQADFQDEYDAALWREELSKVLVPTILDARQFGAKGDGTTDDTVALQVALDAVATSGRTRSLYIPGTDNYYKISASLTKAANVSIYGDGTSSQVRQVTADTNVLTINSSAGGSIKDIYVHGTGAGTGNGIVLSGSANVVISGVTAKNNGGSGIAVYSSSSNCVVENCTTNDNGIGGIDINGSDYVRVSNNYGDGNGTSTGGGAIALYSSNRCVLEGNACNNNSGFGIDARYSTRSSVVGNICNNNTYSGISISSGATGTSSKIVINNNNCEDNGEHGIVLDAGGLAFFIFYCTIVGNSCNDNGNSTTTSGKGIYLEDNIYGTTVIGNVCESNYDAGIEVAAGSRQCTINDNICLNNGTDTGLTDIERAGIRLTDTSIDGAENVIDCIVIGNRCYDTGGSTQKYGIAIDKVDGAKDVLRTMVHSNNLRDNVVTGLIDEGSATSTANNLT